MVDRGPHGCTDQSVAAYSVHSGTKTPSSSAVSQLLSPLD